MTTENYSIGYDQGYQDGWNAAIDSQQITVGMRSFPESNGKLNWTAMFMRKKPWSGLVGSAGGIIFARGEYWNRVAYSVERARFLLGERSTEPSITDYAKDVFTPNEWDGHDAESNLLSETEK